MRKKPTTKLVGPNNSDLSAITKPVTSPPRSLEAGIRDADGRRSIAKQRGVISKLRLTDEIVWDAICKEMNAHFNSNVGARPAKASLAELVARGCDDKKILQNLYLFCGGLPADMEAIRQQHDFAGCKKRMLAISRLLQDASSGIQNAETLLEDLGVTCHFTPDRPSLERYADFLKQLGAVAYRNLASKRITGRDQHLVYLCKMIYAVTGARRYREVAELVTATRQFYDHESTDVETAMSIRKRVTRYRGFRRQPILDFDSELELLAMEKAHPLATNKRKSKTSSPHPL